MLSLVAPALFLIPSCLYDYKYQRMPNEITYTMFASGLIMQAVSGRLKEATISTFTLIILLCFLGRAFKLGGGDIKLILACGMWLGNASPYFLFFTFLTLFIYNYLSMIKKHGIKGILSAIKLEFLFGHTQPLAKVPGAFFIMAGYLTAIFLNL